MSKGGQEITISSIEVRSLVFNNNLQRIVFIISSEHKIQYKPEQIYYFKAYHLLLTKTHYPSTTYRSK